MISYSNEGTRKEDEGTNPREWPSKVMVSYPPAFLHLKEREDESVSQLFVRVVRTETHSSSESIKKFSALETRSSTDSFLTPEGGSNALGDGREERPIPSQSRATIRRNGTEGSAWKDKRKQRRGSGRTERTSSSTSERRSLSERLKIHEEEAQSGSVSMQKPVRAKVSSRERDGKRRELDSTSDLHVDTLPSRRLRPTSSSSVEAYPMKMSRTRLLVLE